MPAQRTTAPVLLGATAELLGRLQHRGLEEGLVEALAVEQAGQGVVFAVVEQALEVLHDAQHGQHQPLLELVEWLRAAQLDQRVGRLFGRQGQQAQQPGLTLRIGQALSAGLLLFDHAGVQRHVIEQGQIGPVRTHRLGERDQITPGLARARQPAPLALVHHDTPQRDLHQRQQFEQR